MTTTHHRLSLPMAAVLCAALQGCVTLDAEKWRVVHDQTCRLDEDWLVRDTLHFARAGTGVDDEDWRNFERDVLAGAGLPLGYTVLDARHAARDADGGQRSLPGKVVTILRTDDAASTAAIDHVVARYRQAFGNDSVLRENIHVCVKP